MDSFSQIDLDSVLEVKHKTRNRQALRLRTHRSPQFFDDFVRCLASVILPRDIE